MSEDAVLDIAKYLGTSEGRCWGGQKSGSDCRLQDLTCLISVAVVEAVWGLAAEDGRAMRRCEGGERMKVKKEPEESQGQGGQV